MRVYFIILFLFCCNNLFPQGDRFRKGEVIDTIWVDKKFGESFSFYMPKSYEPSLPTPVIFIFEPMARGRTGIDPFIATADTYGYLLVCSNNTKNGPFEQNYPIIDRLFAKVFTSLKLDPKRVYTSGFSGGGRLASSVALKTNQIQGVVSCGAAFTVNSGGLPTTQSFSYATIIGAQDMNYYELTFTHKYLTKTKLPYEVFTPDINHRWPTRDQILMAFDWMQLEAYKNLLLPADSAITKRIYNKYYHQAQIEEKDKRLLAASNEYRRILNNFKRYYQMDTIQEKLNNLEQSKAYKSEKKKDEVLLETELALTDELFDRFNTDINKKSYNLGWWENRIEKLKKKLESDSYMEQTMYKRLLYKLFAHGIETANYDTSIKNIEQKMFCYDICMLIYPAYALPYIKQIENAVALGKSDLAIDYLEKLLNTGFDEKERILKNESIKTLENMDRFKKLMTK
ncbi:hypothetical protein [Lutimonas sp.]|uniref:hypothetical protein n=1 Tax=Lutimonas sp. TaxID=1872403 RepID=UPI003C76DD83